MRKVIFVGAMIAMMAVGVAANADEFAGQSGGQGYQAAVNDQAANAQMADPTAPNSFRSHGRP